MTRQKAIEAVVKILDGAGLGEAVKISNRRSGAHGEAQCIYIERIPVKGNGELIKKLKTIPEFRGHKNMNFENRFEFDGWFEVV